MYCIHCGAKLNEGDRFCSVCGHEVIVKSAADAALHMPERMEDAPGEGAVSEEDAPGEGAVSAEDAQEVQQAGEMPDVRERTWNEEFGRPEPRKKVRVLVRIGLFLRAVCLIIVCAVLCTALAFGTRYLYQTQIYPRIIYTQAQSAYDEGRYEDAIALYDEIADFKDSAERKDGAVYALAKETYARGAYLDARELFLSIRGYEDSAQLADQAMYVYAKELIAQENFEEAITALTEIKNYEDSKSLIKSCRYKIAMKAMEAQEYEDAIELFEALGSYEDSAEMAKHATYLLALQEAENGEYGMALDRLQLLAEEQYGDSAEQATRIMEVVAQEYCAMREADDDNAVANLRLLIGYGFFQYDLLETPDQDAAIALVNPTLIDLKRYYNDGHWTSGSGFIYKITESRVYFVSVDHVLEEMTSGVTKLTFMDGETIETTIDYATMANSECAIFSVEVSDIPASTLITLSEIYVDEGIYEILKEGDTIIKYAENWSGEGKDVEKISTFIDMNAYETSEHYLTRDGYFVTTHSAIQGMSGTAAFDCYGRLVGVVCFIHPNKGTDYECRINGLGELFGSVEKY